MIGIFKTEKVGIGFQMIVFLSMYVKTGDAFLYNDAHGTTDCLVGVQNLFLGSMFAGWDTNYVPGVEMGLWCMETPFNNHYYYILGTTVLTDVM